MPISSVGRVNNARGVTLMEMVVVMTIIGLIVTIAAPSVTAGIDSVRISTAGDSLAAFVNAAVNHAGRRQRAVELTIFVRENRLSAISAEPGFTREMSLPDGVFLEAVLPQNDEGQTEIRRFILMPGGTVPGISIRFANHRGARRILRLDPMTGFPRITRLDRGESQ